MSVNSFEVCVVDDDVDLARIISDILSMDGFLCPVFTGPSEAYQAILTARPKLIISDIRMKPINGIQFMESMKNQGCDATFLFFTGNSPFSHTQLKAKGARGLFRKPDGISELIDEALASLSQT